MPRFVANPILYLRQSIQHFCAFKFFTVLGTIKAWHFRQEVLFECASSRLRVTADAVLATPRQAPFCAESLIMQTRSPGINRTPLPNAGQRGR